MWLDLLIALVGGGAAGFGVSWWRERVRSRSGEATSTDVAVPPPELPELLERIKAFAAAPAVFTTTAKYAVTRIGLSKEVAVFEGDDEELLFEVVKREQNRQGIIGRLLLDGHEIMRWP